MNYAILLVENSKESKLLTAYILDNLLINSVRDRLNNIGIDNIYIVCSENIKVDGFKCASSLDKLTDEIEKDSKVLLLSPFYPFIDEDYLVSLLNCSDDASLLSCKDEVLNCFMVNSNYLNNLNNVDFKAIEVDEKDSLRIKDFEDIYKVNGIKKKRILKEIAKNGVSIVDIDNTYIGEYVEIESGTIIYPNVVIEGRCHIGKNNTITSGSHIINSNIGDNNQILSSRIIDSTLHNSISLGPNSHLRNNSEVFDNCRIGNFVEFKNTKFGKGSKCAHLTYVGDCTVGEACNFGCGVVTVNYDGKNKYRTNIGNHVFIGSNANLIAPLEIGDYSVIAAGSTLTKDLPANDMVIARAREVFKQGQGIDYIKKENKYGSK